MRVEINVVSTKQQKDEMLRKPVRYGCELPNQTNDSRFAFGRFLSRETGSSGIAYALILAAIAVAALLSVSKLEISLSGSFTTAGRGLGQGSKPTANSDGFRASSARLPAADVDSPKITRLNPPSAGSYHVGQALVFILQADESVRVNGTPSLPLSLGDRDVAAPFYKQNKPNQLIFRYVVQPEDRGSGAVHLTTLSINQTGGEITDLSGNRLLPGLPGTAHLVDITISPNCPSTAAC